LLKRPVELPVREALSASIVAVVHHVLDGIRSTTRASVASSWAAGGSASFGSSVIDLITTVTAILESMIKPDPMPDLVRHDLASIQSRSSTSTRKEIEIIDDSVAEGVSRVILGEGSPTGQGNVAVGGDGVDIECVGLAEVVLSLELAIVVITDGKTMKDSSRYRDTAWSLGKSEAKAGRGVNLIDYVESFPNDRILVDAFTSALVVKSVPIDGDSGRSLVEGQSLGQKFSLSELSEGIVPGDDRLELLLKSINLLLGTRVSAAETVSGGCEGGSESSEGEETHWR